VVRLAAGLEEVVPVVSGRTETFDNRMQSDHRGGHGVAGGVGVEAAADLAGMLQQGLEPKRIGPGTGRRRCAQWPPLGDAPPDNQRGTAFCGVARRCADALQRKCRTADTGHSSGSMWAVCSRVGLLPAPITVGLCRSASLVDVNT